MCGVRGGERACGDTAAAMRQCATATALGRWVRGHKTALLQATFLPITADADADTDTDADVEVAAVLHAPSSRYVQRNQSWHNHTVQERFNVGVAWQERT